MILIAGPCSAESEEQLRSTANELRKNEKVSFFRAGLWKPRSQPGSFEGVGDRGIDWMVRVQRDYSLP
nr:3-deoxy-7-phosphoheptulonate synthase [Saprospiraceae bacterium]